MGVPRACKSTSPTCWPSALYKGLAVRRRAVRQEHALATSPPGQRHTPPTCCCRAASSSTATSPRSARPSRSEQVQEFVTAGTSTPTRPGPAPLGRRHRAELRARPQPGARAPTGKRSTRRQVQLDQGAALARPRDGGVGPLSRMVLGYLQPQGVPVDQGTIDGVLKQLDVPVTALFSTLGRTAARRDRIALLLRPAARRDRPAGGNIKAGDTATANVEKWDRPPGRRSARAPASRGAARALGHWVKIKGTARSRTTSAWCRPPGTAAARCQGQIGAFEASLMNTPLAKADQPLEILRTIHSVRPLPRVQHA